MQWLSHLTVAKEHPIIQTRITSSSLVKGEYGKTPVAIDPAFREKITGSPEERPYDTGSFHEPANPELPEFGGVKLAQNEEEFLLLELLPPLPTHSSKTNAKLSLKQSRQK